MEEFRRIFSHFIGRNKPMSSPQKSLGTRFYEGLFGTPEQIARRKELDERGRAKVAATNEDGGTFVSTGKVGVNQGVPISATVSSRKRARRSRKTRRSVVRKRSF
jgi:hypothetical protein